MCDATHIVVPCFPRAHICDWYIHFPPHQRGWPVFWVKSQPHWVARMIDANQRVFIKYRFIDPGWQNGSKFRMYSLVVFSARFGKAGGTGETLMSATASQNLAHMTVSQSYWLVPSIELLMIHSASPFGAPLLPDTPVCLFRDAAPGDRYCRARGPVSVSLHWVSID